MTKNPSILILSGKKIPENILRELRYEGFEFDQQAFQTIFFRPLEKELILQNKHPWIFTSSNAIEAISPLLNILKNKKAFVLSEKTKKTAQKYGFEILESAPNGLELSKKILSRNEKSVFHPTTPNHRKEIVQFLRLNNINYRSIFVYDQIPQKINFKPWDGILFFSPSQVDNFMNQHFLDPQLPVFSIGPTTTAHLHKKQHQNIQMATSPSVKSVLESLIKYFKRNEK